MGLFTFAKLRKRWRNMKNPEISVIMSTYNENIKHLTEAIESVLNQTFRDFEFLIVLDNPENSLIKECVKIYAVKDTRIVVIENEKNLGLTKSLNKAIVVANGFYMSRMDADDVMMKCCLEKELKIIKKDKLDLVAVSKKNIDQKGNEIGVFTNSFSPEQMRYLLPYDNSINHPTVLVRLDVIKREGGYREIKSCEDYDLWIRMLGHGSRMKIVPEILLLYRIRPDGICESNPYQQYCSKRFVMDMYKKSKKDLQILNNLYAYEDFLSKRDMTDRKKSSFNKAYKEFYKAITALRKRRMKCFIKYIINAVHYDYEIMWVICNKLGYQFRKKIICNL